MRKTYRSGKIGSIVRLTASIIKADPSLVDDFDRLKATLIVNMPELTEKSHCINCGASMKEYDIRFDYWQAILLLRMAEQVRTRQRSGMDFTIANQVRVPELDISLTAKCKTTQASKLGLVVQLRNINKHKVPGVWVITRRGWEALRGNRVPAKVTVFREEITERDNSTITLAEALQSHYGNLNKSKTPNSDDFRNCLDSYKPEEWVGFMKDCEQL